MNATKQYYINSVTENNQNKFYLSSKPDLLSPDYSSSGDGGWGETWTFRVNVKDLDSGNVNVSLWINLTGSWQLLNSTTCSNCGSLTQKTFTGHKFVCGNIGSKSFKFNATDQFNYTNETSFQSFTIDKDDTISDYTSGHLSSVNREGSSKSLLVVRIRDVDNSNNYTEGVQGRIFVTKDYSAYDSGTSNTTNSSGYLNIYFDPDCNYNVGSQNWKGGVYDDTCYKNSNNTPVRNVSINGQLYVGLYEPQQYSEFNVSNLVNHTWNVSSDCYAEEGNITSVSNTLALNNSGTTSSCTSINEPSTGNYNCTWNSTSQPQGNWSINITTSKTNYNSNTSLYQDWFYLV